MTKPEAHDLLDLARAGGLVPLHFITKALGVTGDLAPSRKTSFPKATALPFISYPEIAVDESDDLPIVRFHRPAGQWERSRGAGLLAAAKPFDGLMT
jgi:hypothetical protein